jgi:hypothetical protein
MIADMTWREFGLPVPIPAVAGARRATGRGLS